MGLLDAFSGKIMHLNKIVYPSLDRLKNESKKYHSNKEESNNIPMLAALYSDLAVAIGKSYEFLFEESKVEFKKNIKSITPKTAQLLSHSLASLCFLHFVVDHYQIHRNFHKEPGDFATQIDHIFIVFLDESERNVHISLKNLYLENRNEDDVQSVLFNYWYDHIYWKEVLGQLGSNHIDESTGMYTDDKSIMWVFYNIVLKNFDDLIVPFSLEYKRLIGV